MADVGGRPLVEARVRLRADGSQLGPEAVSEATKAAKAAAAATTRELSKGYKDGVSVGSRAAATEAKTAGAQAGRGYADNFTRDAQTGLTRNRGKIVPGGSPSAAAAEAGRAGAAAGDAYGKGFTRDAQQAVQARAGDISGSGGAGRSKAQQAGAVAGQSYGQGFTSGAQAQLGQGQATLMPGGSYIAGSAQALTAGATAGQAYGNGYVQTAQQQLLEAQPTLMPGGSYTAGAAQATTAGATAGTAYGTGFKRSAQLAIEGNPKLIQGEVISSVDAAATKSGKAYGSRFGARAVSSIEEEFRGQAVGMGKALASAFAIQEGINLFKDSVAIASDLNEVGSALNVTYGEKGAAAVTKWSSEVAKGFGLATLDAQQANATFGIFAKSAGLSGDEAVNFSTKLTGLAGDLTSFYNPAGGTAQSIEAIGAALRGESEPIRSFGVLLDDATLRQEALALGLTKTTKDALTPQQKVLASYSQILKQTSAAQGDFARTSDSLANSQRTVENEFKDFKATLGEGMLPAVRDTTAGLKSLLQTINEIPEDGVAGALKSAAMGGVLSTYSQAKEAISGINEKLGEGDRAAAKAAESSRKQAEYTADLAARQTAAAAATREAAAAAGANSVILDKSTIFTQQAAKAARDEALGVGKAVKAVGEHSGAAKEAARSGEKLYTLYDGTAAKAVEFNRAQKQLNDTLTDSPWLDTRDAARSYEEAVDAAAQAARENGNSLDISTEKGRTNQAALDGLASSALQYLDSINKQDGPGKKFSTALERQRADLIAAAKRFGLGDVAAKKYADRILKIPTEAATRVRLAGISTVNYSLDTLLDRVNSLDGRRIQIYSSAANVREDRRAHGGPVPGTPSEVDTEPYLLARGEYVVRSREASKPGNRRLLEAMNAGVDIGELSGGGGATVVSGPAATVDTAAIAAAVAAGVAQAMAALGPGRVVLNDAVVGQFMRVGGSVAGIDGQW